MNSLVNPPESPLTPLWKRGVRGDFKEGLRGATKVGQREILKGLRESIKVATYKDIPGLKKIATSLFSESRFYRDPFFSKEEADKLYQTWIENSVKGAAADIVFWIPRRGFITCKKSGEHSGEIVLLGIKKSFRGKGCGTALVKESMIWFHAQDIPSITVRTQVKNLGALNFYLKLGFSLRGYDIVFGNIL